MAGGDRRAEDASDREAHEQGGVAGVRQAQRAAGVQDEYGFSGAQGAVDDDEQQAGCAQEPVA